MKNIIIYTHMENFSFTDGGTLVQYLLANCLEELGQIVRIYPQSGQKSDNPVFSKFYNNDFPIDDNTVVVYCEGTHGNPLNAKYVVRWMLSKLGQNVCYDMVNTWGKTELVYYFNSEDKIANNPDKINSLYKFLNVLYLHPCIVNNNLQSRNGTCFTIRKSMSIHKTLKQAVHPSNSFEITRNHTQLECIEIFNNHKYFVSYDSLTFLSVISALCGCISIVITVDGLSKQDWLNTTAATEYLKETGEQILYGIAYGRDDIQNAKNTLHMAKEQWNRIVQFGKEKYVNKFINDINNWDNNINTIQTNFFQ